MKAVRAGYWAYDYAAKRLKDLGRMAKGESVGNRCFNTALTLDWDDVKIAQRLLDHRKGWQTCGEAVERYETEFARWNGSSRAFSFSSGREALSACIEAVGLKEGDEAIVPGYTCVVVPNAFRYAGVKTVYCDIELEAFGPDVASVEKRIGPRTRAILIQHLYGLVCRDYEALLDLARERGLVVIEDCTQATGAEFKGKKVGVRAAAAFYSSEQSKVLNTVQGGMAVANEMETAARLAEIQERSEKPTNAHIDKLLHTLIMNYFSMKHPQRWLLGDVVEKMYRKKRLISTLPVEKKGEKPPHYGRRMTDAVAKLGLNQLKKVDKYNELRRKSAEGWEKWCDANGYARPLVVKGSRPVYLRYPVLVEPEKKQDASWALKEIGEPVGVWFIGNLHPTITRIKGCPNADFAVERCINLPGARV